jgi:hypothetical protein
MQRIITLAAAALVTTGLLPVAHAQQCTFTASFTAMVCPTMKPTVVCPTEAAMVEVAKAIQLGANFALVAAVKYNCSVLRQGTKLVIGNIDHDDDNRFSAMQVGVPNGNISWISPFALGSDWVRDHE